MTQELKCDYCDIAFIKGEKIIKVPSQAIKTEILHICMKCSEEIFNKIVKEQRTN